PRCAATVDHRSGAAGAAVSRLEPSVSPRLLLQRVAVGALGEPGTFVVFERCVSRAAQSDLAYRASACDRGTATGEVGGLFGRLGADSSEGAGRIARGSVRAERATGRNSRVARIRDRCRSASRSARLGAQADRPEARRARTESRV